MNDKNLNFQPNGKVSPASNGMTTALITGITGQDGPYLAKLLLNNGYKVVGLTRDGIETAQTKLSYLKISEQVTLEKFNVLNEKEVKDVLIKYQPDEIYNLAAQSSVDYSFKEPAETITFNTQSVLNLLEGIRTLSPKTKFYQATSCEIYGLGNKLPITEEAPLNPSSPYGVSKAIGHLLVKNYRETYGLFCVSGILFNHESHLRSSKYFLRKLIRTAINISQGQDEYITLWQPDNKRDLGHSPKYVEAMWLMLQQNQPKDYIICSGKSVSIREISEYVFKKIGASLERIKVDLTKVRQPNITDLYGDNTKAKNELGWQYDLTYTEMLDKMIEEELTDNKIC